MTKHINVTNGDYTVGLDSYGQIAEIYYPTISNGNLVGGNQLRHRIGLYSEDAIHWIDDGTWHVRQDYFPNCLISRTIANNPWLNIRLEIKDYVDSELDILVRNIQVINLSTRPRKAKLFLDQCFIIGSGNNDGDSAEYIPAKGYKSQSLPCITHYHNETSFLVTGTKGDGTSFDDYSVGRFGHYNNEELAGVWCDASDGHLARNCRDHGKTDSIICFNLDLEPKDSEIVNYFIAAGHSNADAIKTLAKFQREGLDVRERHASEHWQTWLQPAVDKINQLPETSFDYDITTSLLNLKSNLQNNGAIIFNAVDQPLSGNLVVIPALSAMTAANFMQFGLDIDSSRILDFFTPIISRDGYLLPYYTSTGAPGPSCYAWDDANSTIKPIRVADSAIFLLILCRMIKLTFGKRQLSAEWKKRWSKLGKPLADFLADYIDPVTKLPLPSYSIVHGSKPTTTLLQTSLVYLSLNGAADIAGRVKDTNDVIKYQTVAEDISENTDVFWNEDRGYFYGSIDRQGDNFTYDSTIYSDALLGAATSNLFSEDQIAKARQTLINNHVCNNGTYLIKEDADPRGEEDMIMVLSLAFSALHNIDEDLVKACAKLVTSSTNGCFSAIGDVNGILVNAFLASVTNLYRSKN